MQVHIYECMVTHIHMHVHTHAHTHTGLQYHAVRNNALGRVCRYNTHLMGSVSGCVSSPETSVRNPVSISLLAIGRSPCCMGGGGGSNWCSGTDAMGRVGIVADLNAVGNCANNNLGF